MAGGVRAAGQANSPPIAAPEYFRCVTSPPSTPTIEEACRRLWRCLRAVARIVVRMAEASASQAER